MTSVYFHPGTPQHVKDQWIDPMTGTNLKGEKPPQGGQQGGQNPTGYKNVEKVSNVNPDIHQAGSWVSPAWPVQQTFGEQIGGFGKQLGGYGEQLGGFGEQLGGYGEQMGGFGEQLGGFQKQMGGLGEQFEKIDSRLQNMEQGITSLTDKMGVQQQPQNPFQGL